MDSNGFDFNGLLRVRLLRTSTVFIPLKSQCSDRYGSLWLVLPLSLMALTPMGSYRLAPFGLAVLAVRAVLVFRTVHSVWGSSDLRSGLLHLSQIRWLDGAYSFGHQWFGHHETPFGLTRMDPIARTPTCGCCCRNFDTLGNPRCLEDVHPTALRTEKHTF